MRPVLTILFVSPSTFHFNEPIWFWEDLIQLQPSKRRMNGEFTHHETRQEEGLNNKTSTGCFLFEIYVCTPIGLTASLWCNKCCLMLFFFFAGNWILKNGDFLLNHSIYSCNFGLILQNTHINSVFSPRTKVEPVPDSSPSLRFLENDVFRTDLLHLQDLRDVCCNFSTWDSHVFLPVFLSKTLDSITSIRVPAASCLAASGIEGFCVWKRLPTFRP